MVVGGSLAVVVVSITMGTVVGGRIVVVGGELEVVIGGDLDVVVGGNGGDTGSAVEN